MKLHFLFSFIILALVSKAQSPIIESPEKADIGFKQLIAAENLHYKQSKSVLATNANVGNNYDLKYHRLEFFVDPAVRYINGIVTTYFTVVENTQQVSFELMNDLTVDSVIRNTQALTFSHIDNVVIITMPAALTAGQLDSITVY